MKTKIKKSFTRLVKVFEELDLIESNYTIISNGILYDLLELTIKEIFENLLIYEKFII